ncbi:MAG: sulfatase [Rubripirellula sp.]
MPTPLRLCGVIASLVICLGHGSAESTPPNIVLILADDLGWNDLGCYGETVFETPNLDRLAGQGTQFTQAYAPAPICSASRASILTGKTPARLGFEFVTKNEAGFQPVVAPLRAPAFTLNLPLREITIAEVLRDAGYETAFFGKWHLNQHHKRYLGWSPTHGPPGQGFQVAEEDFGSHPYSYWSQKSKRGFADLPNGEFPMDSMNEKALTFLRSKHQRPFFLMLSHFYVHTPVHTRAGWLHKQYLRKLPKDHPRREKLAHYGAMVTNLDHLVGRVLSTLDQTGLAKETLVVFTSDNGGHPEFAGNAPLRGSKWNLYEGGIRVPLIMRWPGSIAANKTCQTPITGTDLMPTFAEVAGTETPPEIDGDSILRLLDHSASDQRDLLWHFPYYHPESTFHKVPKRIGVDDGFTSQTRPHSVLRSGPWKLIHFYEHDRDQLFHLPSDPAEQEDLAKKQPRKAAELRIKLETKLTQSGARLPVTYPRE